MKPIPPNARDMFQSETYMSSPPARVTLSRWDYRDRDGVLHSGIAHGDHRWAEAEARRFGYRATPSACNREVTA